MNIARNQGRPSGGAARFAHWMPALLLMLGLSSLFVFQSNGFHPVVGLRGDTAQHLARAENLSPKHYFRIFYKLTPGTDGGTRYDLYGRFPVGGLVLFRLAMLPFEGDLSAMTTAARMLALALFFAAALLAFLALRRVVDDPWVAAAATLFALASYHILSCADTVSTEMAPDLFAVMLVFHGMVIYAQDGRFRQLVAKTCIALLIGWHVYALLLPMIALGLIDQAVASWRGQRAAGSPQVWLPRLGTSASALVRSRLTLLGVTALLFGTVVLGFNIVNEYTALKGERPLAELPAVESMLYRTGISPTAKVDREGQHWRPPWQPFLFLQFHRLGTEMLPFATPLPRDRRGRLPSSGLGGGLVVGLGVVSLAGVLLALGLTNGLGRREKLLLGALALSGPCWTVAMRHHTYIPDHNHEAIFLVGVPLTAFTLALLQVRGPTIRRLVAVAAAAVFALSAFKVSKLAEPTPFEVKALRAEFDAIRETTRGKTVFITSPERRAPFTSVERVPTLDFYLAGGVLQYDGTQWPNRTDYRGLAHRTRAYDFILSDQRVEHPALLTPDNRFAFLYRGASFDRAHDFHLPQYRREHAAVTAHEPTARAEFDVYWRDGRLAYLKTPCTEEDTQGIFFLHVVGEEPDGRPTADFENLDFRFGDRGVAFDGKCLALVDLPDHPIASLATGRYLPGEDGTIWRADLQQRQRHQRDLRKP